MNEELLISTKGRIGYKGFNVKNDGTLYCRDKNFKVGEIATVAGKLKICENGIHFCWNINDVNDYYTLKDHVICEVEPLGKIVANMDGNKCCTNKIKVIRMLTLEEVLKLSNSGKHNTGIINTGNYNTGDYNTGNYNTGDCNTGNCNTGNYNTGYRNTGYYNTGDRNTGNHNTGDYNTGDRNTGNRNTGNYNTGNGNTGNRNTGYYNTGNRNTGYRNTGDCNTGYCNTGYCNTGNYNTGDYNTGDYNTGFFNTHEHNCFLFDVPSDMTPTEFRQSKYYNAISSSPFKLTEWVSYTAQEKEADKSKELIGGYLKVYEYKVACANWWKYMSEKNKEIIKSMPNFDAKKFKEITGIDVDKEEPTKE